MQRGWLGIALVAIVSFSCTPKSELAKVQEGKQFVLVDSLPAPLRQDDWKTLRWINLDARKMSKEGGTCSGHVGLLERDKDKQHWLVAGASCGGTHLLSSLGNRLEGHAVPTYNEKDQLTLEARFEEALEPGSYILFSKLRVVRDGTKDDDAITDLYALKRRGDQLVPVLEIGVNSILDAVFEGSPPKALLIKAEGSNQHLRYHERDQKYVHDRFVSNLVERTPNAPTSAQEPPPNAPVAPDAAPPAPDGAPQATP